MLADLLREHREAILERWTDKILRTYPQDAAGFLQKENDRFRNPVGHTIKTETKVLYSALLDGIEQPDLTKSLDRIVRVRSVQDLSPSQAMAFVFLLKTSVRELLVDKLDSVSLLQELSEYESRIDGLALAAFDNFMECKQALFELRAREVRRETAMLVRQVNRIYDQQLPQMNDDRPVDTSTRPGTAKDS